MELVVRDTAFAHALEQSLGHPSPFAIEECEQLNTSLTLQHVRDFSPLQHCSQLKRLNIFASELEHLDILEPLENLIELRIVCCPVNTIAAIVSCPLLEYVELNFTLAEDTEPLFHLPKLQYAALLGNPWNEKSFDRLQQNLHSKKELTSPIFDLSSLEDWKVTRELKEKGLTASFSDMNMESILVKPGIPTILNANCDFFPLSRDLVQYEMKQPGFTVQGLFEKYYPNRGPESPYYTFDFESHIWVGNRAQTASWIEASGLKDDSKSLLAHFIQRYPDAVFYREDAILLERREKSLGIRLPEWLKTIRQVLVFLYPHERIKIQVDAFDHPSIRSTSTSFVWYEFDLIGIVSSDQRKILDKDHLFAIANWSETSYSTLAIRLDDPTDQRIYEYAQDDIDAHGQIPADLITAVFDSYAHMLSHIKALQRSNGEIVQGLR